MKGQPTGHTIAFRAKHMMAGEVVLGYLEGWAGSGNNVCQLILTNQRLCVFRKGLMKEQLTAFDLSRLTSIDKAERSGSRFLKVCTSTDELTFGTTEPQDIWEVVLDRLEKIRADPAWTPPPIAPSEQVVVKPASAKLPAVMFGAPGKTPLALMIDRLASNHELDELFVSPVDQSAIGLNFRDSKLVLVSKTQERAYGFDQIVSVEALADDVTLSQTNRGSQLVGAAVGGALFGGVGLLLGGLTGSNRAAKRVKSLVLKLTLNDLNTPTHTVSFFATREKKGLPATSAAVTSPGAALDRIHAQLGLAMRQVRTVKASQEGVAAELEKIWELKEKGALTEAEFDMQKKRILIHEAPKIATEQRPDDIFSLTVSDWGLPDDRLRVVATMREMEPSLGPIEAARLYGKPSFSIARDLSLSEAARIKARLFSVGVIAELSNNAAG